MGAFESNSEEEYCPRCGTRIYAFSKKKAASDGKTYCIKCAEEIDRKYLQEYTCSVCKRVLEKSEVKFVLPSSSFGLIEMPLHKRLLCADCYAEYTRHPSIAALRKAKKLNPLARISRQIRPMIEK